MISQKTHFELKISNKDHIYQFDPTATLADIFSALDTMRSYVYGRIKEAEEQQKAKPQDNIEQKPQG